jgi:hypothetical protein
MRARDHHFTALLALSSSCAGIIGSGQSSNIVKTKAPHLLDNLCDGRLGSLRELGGLGNRRNKICVMRIVSIIQT